MTKPTSAICLAQIEAEGLLHGMRLEVYRMLLQFGPLTGRELTGYMAHPGETSTSYHKRLSELERLGMAQVVDRRPCRVSGRLAESWAAIDTLPDKTLPKRKKRFCLNCGWES